MTSYNDGVWTTSLGDLQCLEAVALITGGMIDNFNISSPLQEVEVWTEDGQRKRLSDLPYKNLYHSVDYIDGGLYLCGGGGNKTKCLKGEYQPSTKGTLVHSCFEYSAQTMQSINLNLSPGTFGTHNLLTIFYLCHSFPFLPILIL